VQGKSSWLARTKFGEDIMTFLQINNISKTFGSTDAVKDFNLTIEKGELVSFLGPSGCGKTTTLRMVAGFEIPSGGKIVINNQDITNTPPNQRDVGMVFQSYALFPNMTVADNIGFGLKVAKKSTEETKNRVAEMLELINMPEYGDRYPAQLSLRSEIRSIQQKLGITAIYVTHDQEEALSISDRVVVMYEGQMEQVGTPFEIYNFPQTAFVASFVGTLNAVEAVVIDPKANTLRIDGIPLQAAKGLENKQSGDKLTIAIRPERFSFSSEQKKANLLDAVIENITFLGSIVRIQVVVGSTKFYMDTFNNPFLELPKIGDKTQITCSREAVLVLNH
jgi:putative spermidine/putrescine transport system ATP-binding protein